MGVGKRGSRPEEERALRIEYLSLWAFFPPLLFSCLITGSMIWLAPYLGLVDIPSSRKVHTRPIPKGAGLAIFIGWIITFLWLGFRARYPFQREYEDWEPDSPLIGLTPTDSLLTGFTTADLAVWGGIGMLIVLLGLVDDIRPLPWQLRLGIQFIAAIAALIVYGGIPGHYSSILEQSLCWAVAVIWIVGLTNAFNMLDNMDALSGGVALITAGHFAAFAFGHYPYLMLMGALVGFLLFNYPPARIFMGDAGSTFLGFFFGTSSLHFGMTAQEQKLSSVLISAKKEGPASWPLILCFLTIPCYDLVSVVTIRLSQGRSPFHADKQHLSHRLVALGLSPPLAVGAICLLALGIGLGGEALRRFGSDLLLVYLAGCWLSLAAFDYLTRKKRQTKIETS
jgi:UDP-GlcNAc:undecaprenyl-phosphate GlcNAc-1-phosphate transferase